MGKIVVIGSSNTDMVVKTGKSPVGGETVLGGSFFMAQGGKGANQAVAAVRSGASVSFITKLGRDVFGEAALKNFKKDGIDTRYVMFDKNEPSGVALITIDRNAQNSIVVAPGSNWKLLPADIKKAESAIQNASCVVLQQEIPEKTVACAVVLAAKHGVPVILNPAPARKIDKKVLKGLFLLNPNETEAEILTGIRIENTATAKEAGVKLLSLGVSYVLITMGKKGVFGVGKGFEMFVPAFKVKAVDTTAAGDAFTGGFAAAFVAKKDLYECVKFGSAVAALAVTKPGAQSSIPYKGEVDTFLRKRK